MAKTKNFLIIAIVVIVVILIALIIISIPKKESKEEGKPEETLAIVENIYGLSGEIKEIRDKTLLVEAKILLADPSKEPIKKTVKILVSDGTKILKVEFPKEIPEGSTEPFFPEETEISFGDLKIGDKIDIGAVNDISENIKNKMDIVAETINVIE